MDMLTAVTADVMNKLSPDAGIVLFNVDISGVANAAAMAALIEENRGKAGNWGGVSDGDIKVTEGRKNWSPSFNGKRMSFKGDKFLDTSEPKISFTMLEYTPENFIVASGAADKSGSGGHITVTPRASYKDTDYLENVLWCTMLGHGGIHVVELKNALCTKGIDGSAGDKKVAQLAVEFVGHQDDATKLDKLPIEYHFFAAEA